MYDTCNLKGRFGPLKIADLTKYIIQHYLSNGFFSFEIGRYVLGTIFVRELLTLKNSEN